MDSETTLSGTISASLGMPFNMTRSDNIYQTLWWELMEVKITFESTCGVLR